MRIRLRALLLLLTLAPLPAQALLCRFALDPGTSTEFSRAREGSRAELIEYLARRIPEDGRSELRAFLADKLERDPLALETPEYGWRQRARMVLVEGVRRPKLVAEWDAASSRALREMAFDTVERRFAEGLRRAFEGRPRERDDLLEALAESLLIETHLPRRSTRMARKLKQARFTVLGILSKTERELLRSLELDRPVREALKKNDLELLDAVVREQVKTQNAVARTVKVYRWFSKAMTLAVALAILWEIKNLAFDEQTLAWEELLPDEQNQLAAAVDRLRWGESMSAERLRDALTAALGQPQTPDRVRWLEAVSRGLTLRERAEAPRSRAAFERP